VLQTAGSIIDERRSSMQRLSRNAQDTGVAAVN
jgi:hypothetical protein